MASLLPSVTSTLKLEPDIRKQLAASSLTVEKNPSISFPRSQTTTQLDRRSLEPQLSLDFQETLSLIKENQEIELSHYVPLLQQCIDSNSLSNARTLHAHIIKTATTRDFFIMTFVVNVYAKCGKMDDARKAFNDLPRRNVVAWTILITGYIKNSQPKLAAQVFLEMLKVGSYPTHYTLSAAFGASSALNCINFGKQIHAYTIKYKIQHDTSVGNSLCSFYSNCDSLDSAVKGFQEIRDKNIVSWTSVISACGDNSKASTGLNFFSQMLSEGFQPNELTFSSVLSLCCTMLYPKLGLQIHSLSTKLGYGPNLQITNSLMYLYLKCGRINEALNFLEGAEEEISLVTWNAVIAGHAQMMDLTKNDILAYRQGTEGLKIFSKLHKSGTKPDLFTFSSVLTLCSKLMALEQGEQVHAQTLKSGFVSEVVLSTALVNMYNKCGSIEKASKAFTEMSIRTLISWTSIISAFANHGKTKQVVEIFEDMRLTGVRPNQITFVGVLSACCHAGMVKEALEYFEMMQNEYKIKPVMDHYGCLIEMFVRLNRLEDAFDLVKKMNVRPNEFIWSLLVVGCRNYGNIELGVYASEQLLKLEPEDFETYALVMNFYLSAEKWEEVSEVKELVKGDKIRKVEDWSWISLKGTIHSFKQNDQSHPRMAEIHAFFDEIAGKAKKAEYELGNNFISDHQSEKLAIGFGFLSTCSLAPIRIRKSVSMCKDSHDFVKVVSLITGRTIVIRDSKRLHNFVHGECSCGDFVNFF